MKLYWLLGYLLRPPAIVAMYVYSRLTNIPRARVVVVNERQEVLLVRSWLGGRGWAMPGGGAQRHETPEQAAVRELGEETGMHIATESLQPLFSMNHAGHQEVVFRVEVEKRELPGELPRSLEIKEAAWFPLSELPHLEKLAAQIVAVMAEKP